MSRSGGGKRSAGAAAMGSIAKNAGKARLGERGGADAREVLLKLGIVGPSRIVEIELGEDEEEDEQEV